MRGGDSILYGPHPQLRWLLTVLRGGRRGPEVTPRPWWGGGALCINAGSLNESLVLYPSQGYLRSRGVKTLLEGRTVGRRGSSGTGEGGAVLGAV